MFAEDVYSNALIILSCTLLLISGCAKEQVSPNIGEIEYSPPQYSEEGPSVESLGVGRSIASDTSGVACCSEGTDSAASVDVVWNVGALPRGQDFYDSYLGTRLELNTRYDIHLTLGFPQANSAAGEKPSNAFRDTVCSSTEKDIELTAILVPADQYFRIRKEESMHPIKINAPGLRQYYDCLGPDESPVDAVPPSFGSAVFNVKTSDKVGLGTFSFYLYYKGRNIDIVNAWFGVGQDFHRDGQSYRRHSTPVLFESVHATGVDASLTVYQFDPSPQGKNYIRAIFFVADSGNGQPDYWKWKIYSPDGSLDVLFRNISITADFNEQMLKRNSRRLIKELFSSPQGSDKDRKHAVEAEKHFASFLMNNGSTGNRKPSMYVNMRYGDSTSPNYFLPLRMLWVPLKKDAGEGFFVGHKFNVYYPFQYNTATAIANACVHNWVSILPPLDEKDSALKAARSAMDGTWTEVKENHKVFSRLDEFEDAVYEQRFPRHPDSLFVLSHHDGRGRLYFDHEAASNVDPTLYSLIYTSFPPLESPSLLVLNACESFQPELINQIKNHTNVDTIVATTSAIKGMVAGKFYKCLYDYMKEQQSEVLIGDLYDVMRECMNSSEKPDARYALKDLSYIVIGDEKIKLCSPWLTPEQEGEAIE